MLPLKRQEKILEKLDEYSTVKVPELAKEFGVSETTVRRDLKDLEEKGVIIRDYGGAVKMDRRSTSFEPPYDLKKNQYEEEKLKIGKLASSLVVNGETIVLDAGSTTLEVARFLNERLNLTVVTNDLMVGIEIANNPNMELIVVGGKHRKGVYTLQGYIAEETLAKFNVNRTFLGVDAIDEEVISNVNTEEVPLKQLMVEVAEKVTVVGDHSKFGKRALTAVCNVREVDSIVTDREPLEDTLEVYKEEGIKVLTP